MIIRYEAPKPPAPNRCTVRSTKTLLGFFYSALIELRLIFNLGSTDQTRIDQRSRQTARINIDRAVLPPSVCAMAGSQETRDEECPVLGKLSRWNNGITPNLRLRIKVACMRMTCILTVWRTEGKSLEEYSPRAIHVTST